MLFDRSFKVEEDEEEEELRRDRLQGGITVGRIHAFLFEWMDGWIDIGKYINIVSTCCLAKNKHKFPCP